jgi:hypothetical protein
MMCEQMAKPSDNLTDLREEIVRRLTICLDLLKKMLYDPEKDDPRVLQTCTVQLLDFVNLNEN